ncbi:response regulator [Candidatus Margulisiibacteriota bacterium]
MKKTVAIVDDEKNVLLVEKALLKSNGYEVLPLIGSSTTFDTLKEKQPDLVLMDIVMPEVNGVELTYQLKTDPATKKIKVIAVTGQPILSEKTTKYFDDIVLKPFRSEKLIEKIKSFIG